MSNFLAGSGALELGDGGIRIRDARASEGELIVKMHWLDGMRVEGAMTVEPYWYERFPLPFIRVLDPGPEVSIALE